MGRLPHDAAIWDGSTGNVIDSDVKDGRPAKGDPMTATSSVPPRHWSVTPSDVLLADGSIAVIRSLRADDQEEVLALHEGVSEDTLRMRFFTPSPAAGRAYVAHLFDEANIESVALVAVVRGRIAALATAELLSSERAEVAFLVSDQDRGRGLGSLLLEHLAALGRGAWARPLRGRGARRQLRDAGRVPGGRLRRSLDVRRTARCWSSCAPMPPLRRSTLRTDASGVPRHVRSRPLLYAESVAVVGVRRDGGGLGFGGPRGDSLGWVHRPPPPGTPGGATRVGDLPAHRSLADDRRAGRPGGDRGAGRPGHGGDGGRGRRQASARPS